MAQNFLSCDRDQELLLPPSLREWLPEDHLVWFVLDSVAEMDLAAFYGAYRQDGWGRAAHDPARGRFARSPIRKVADSQGRRFVGSRPSPPRSHCWLPAPRMRSEARTRRGIRASSSRSPLRVRAEG